MNRQQPLALAPPAGDADWTERSLLDGPTRRALGSINLAFLDLAIELAEEGRLKLISGLPPRAIDSLIDPDAGRKLCERLPYALFDLRFGDGSFWAARSPRPAACRTRSRGRPWTNGWCRSRAPRSCWSGTLRRRGPQGRGSSSARHLQPSPPWLRCRSRRRSDLRGVWRPCWRRVFPRARASGCSSKAAPRNLTTGRSICCDSSGCRSRAPTARAVRRSKGVRGVARPAEVRFAPHAGAVNPRADQDLLERRPCAPRYRPRRRRGRLLCAARTERRRQDDDYRHHHVAGREERWHRLGLRPRHRPRARPREVLHRPRAAGNQLQPVREGVHDHREPGGLLRHSAQACGRALGEVPAAAAALGQARANRALALGRHEAAPHDRARAGARAAGS